MKSPRNSPTAFRFTSEAKAALAAISERDGRSMANMMEWLIRKHCEREQLGWPVNARELAKASPPRVAKTRAKKD